MEISYVLIAQFLLYFGVVKLFSSYTLHPVLAGLVASIGIFAIEFTVSAILHSQYGTTLLDLISAPHLLTQLALQIIVGIITFGLLKKYEDSIDAYLAISVAGGIALLSIAPFVAVKIV